MRGPLNLLMGENWLVWHFWNPSQLTYQMAVIELFTNATFADDPFSLMLGGGPDYSKRENGFDGFRHAPGSMGFVTAHVPAVEGTEETLAPFVLALDAQRPHVCVLAGCRGSRTRSLHQPVLSARLATTHRAQPPAPPTNPHVPRAVCRHRYSRAG